MDTASIILIASIVVIVLVTLGVFSSARKRK